MGVSLFVEEVSQGLSCCSSWYVLRREVRLLGEVEEERDHGEEEGKDPAEEEDVDDEEEWKDLEDEICLEEEGHDMTIRMILEKAFDSINFFFIFIINLSLMGFLE